MFVQRNSVLWAMLIGIGELARTADSIAVCPGESRLDRKCVHDDGHRLCARLLDNDGKPLDWGPEKNAGPENQLDSDGKSDFWELTYAKDTMWDNVIRANKGDSSCVCMYQVAALMKKVGCDNVHLRCEAIDVDYVTRRYRQIKKPHGAECIEHKCGKPKGVTTSSSAAPKKTDGQKWGLFSEIFG